MRTPFLLILVCLLTAPLAASAPAADRFYGDVATSRGITLAATCRDVGPGTLVFVRDEVPETGWVRLFVETTCGSPRFAARAQLGSDGWQLGDGETVRGHLRPLDDAGTTWDFRLEVSSCPPAALYEFPLAWMRYEGRLQRPDVVHQ